MAENTFNNSEISDEKIAALKAFCRLSDADVAALSEIRDTAEEIAPEIISKFYDHLNGYEQTARFLQDADQVARLKNIQLDYLSQFFSGPFDAAYFQQRLHVGRKHDQIGLEPHIAIGAYNVLLQLFGEQLGQPIPAGFLAFAKVLLLDVALTVQAYHSASTRRLRRRNAQLQQALRMYHDTELKAENYAKLAGHEIRNSLNAIANACDEVAEDYAADIPSEAKETVAAAAKRCWQLAEVVDQILSTPETGGKPRWVVATDVLAEVRGRMPLHLEGKEVELEFFEVPVRVWADPVGLREVFSNLVANAFHHLDKPQGRVVVDYQEAGDQHIFSVVDNGPGIPSESQQDIFQPFYRGASSSHGKGLGLYFVRQIVEQNRGKVWVESSLGGGSRFSFSLPKEPLTETDLVDAGGAS